MGVEQVDTAKSTQLFLDTCQSRRDGEVNTAKQSPRTCFSKKRKLIGAKKAARSKGEFLKDLEKVTDTQITDEINTSN